MSEPEIEHPSNAHQPPAPEGGSLWAASAELIRTAFVVAIISLTVRVFLWQPNIVEGASMAPVLSTNDYLGVDKISYRLHDPARGDIVVFRYPLKPSVEYVKRIIGLPGETVRIKEGEIYIVNAQHPEGFLLDESAYLAPGTRTPLFNDPSKHDFPVPPGHYFVMGDNRPHSSDSREWGPLEKSFIEGRAIFRMYPLDKITTFPHPNY